MELRDALLRYVMPNDTARGTYVNHTVKHTTPTGFAVQDVDLALVGVHFSFLIFSMFGVPSSSPLVDHSST